MEYYLLKFASLNIVYILIFLSIIYLIFDYLLSTKVNYDDIHHSATDNDIEIFNNYLQDADQRIVSNIENYDKNILTLSTFLLALSLIFIKDIVNTDTPNHIEYIYASWSYFLTSIVITVLSFIVGVKDNELSIYYFYKELLQKKENYKNKKPFSSTLLKYMLFYSGIFLMLGMLYLFLFVKANF